MNVPILIPAYNPSRQLLVTIDELRRLGFENIIIVNDGSSSDCAPIFEKIERIEGCVIVSHGQNKGKGKALKTGMKYICEIFTGTVGFVTADADGQHSAKDIYAVAQALEQNPAKLVLGVRTFDKGIPLRSLVGNVLTKYLFEALVGQKVSDTQTGLRGIPRYLCESFLELKGDRFEYEINMLVATKANLIEILEVEIETVYLNHNQSSHFNPLLDSMKIYLVLFRFTLTALAATTTDFVVFALSYSLTGNMLVGFIVARLAASIVNFRMNRHIVFHYEDNANGKTLIAKYYTLLVCMMLASYGVTNITASYFKLSVLFSKALAETALFAVSFFLQREWVFVDKSRLKRRAMDKVSDEDNKLEPLLR